jgi:hypothetical protein
MIPFSITIDEAAAPHSSLAFLFWGGGSSDCYARRFHFTHG